MGNRCRGEAWPQWLRKVSTRYIIVGIACMMRLLMILKLLAANLEEADPAVYEILQKVRYNLKLLSMIGVREPSLMCEM